MLIDVLEISALLAVLILPLFFPYKKKNHRDQDT